MADDQQDRRADYRTMLPTVNRFVRVHFEVSNSHGVPITYFPNYYLTIRVPPECAGRVNVVETHCSFSSSPNWNDNLTLLVKKDAPLKSLQCVIELKRYYVGMSTIIDSQSYSYETIVRMKSIQFTNSKISIDVAIKTDTDFFIDVEHRERRGISGLLCTQEIEFLRKRKEAALANFKHAGFSDIDDKTIPNIAIIGSGGGMRALIGMCGAMKALEDEKILDCALYTAGVSGSTWYLSTLYCKMKDKKISPTEVRSHLKEKLATAPSCKSLFLNTISSRLSSYYWKYPTFTNLFGEEIGKILLKTSNREKWSEQREKLGKGTCPLPLLAAVRVADHKKIEKCADWVEFSPYEVFMPRYGASIGMETFGDTFYRGNITKKNEEPPVQFLQGICGSAYGVVQNLADARDTWIPIIRLAWKWCKSFFKKIDDIAVAKVPNWMKGLQYEGDLPGTTGDYKTMYLKDLKESDHLSLVDAGTLFNSPYPLVLHPDRKIDLILSFDFSKRDEDNTSPFGELLKAEKWAKTRNIPFPSVNIDSETDDIKEVYVFGDEDDRSPTIMHFVLINKDFRKYSSPGKVRKDAQEEDFANFSIFGKDSEYGTFKFLYKEEAFERLCQLMEFNTKNNMEVMKRCIQNIIKQKKQKVAASK